MAEQLIQVNVEDELGQNFINYSMAVNGDRAIPDAKTGLKPVARRILYIMDDEGVTSNKPHKKSAKVVGSVMGRVHHGYRGAVHQNFSVHHDCHFSVVPALIPLTYQLPLPSQAPLS